MTTATRDQRTTAATKDTQATDEKPKRKRNSKKTHPMATRSFQKLFRESRERPVNAFNMRYVLFHLTSGRYTDYVLSNAGDLSYVNKAGWIVIEGPFALNSPDASKMVKALRGE